MGDIKCLLKKKTYFCIFFYLFIKMIVNHKLISKICQYSSWNASVDSCLERKQGSPCPACTSFYNLKHLENGGKGHIGGCSQ